ADQFLDHLMQESGSWKPLVTNIVGVSLKSHHTTQLYSTSDFEYTYSGRKSSAKQETEMMRLVGHIIESVVNREKQKRPRERYEVLEWKPDLVIGNRYTKNEYGGAHSDKLTNIGPHPIIAGLTLGAGRTFRLIRNKIYGKRTVDLILEHNSLLIMFPPCQEEYKHEIPPVSQKRLHLTGRLIPHPISKETRINLTYRMTIKLETPICFCNLPTELKPVTKKKEHLGKYFYICPTSKCSFFEWF
ncbi:hypothetical protein EDD86DRAFT_180317, partial [Gorgonomyces haynaldii]